MASPIALADLQQIGSADVDAAFLAGDLDRFHKAIERTLVPVPLGIWRKLQCWADSIGGDVPNTFAMAAMLEAALADEPLPDEPADVRERICHLNPSDINSWWRLLFTTKIYLRRSTVYLAARLVERRLGANWATSLLSFDVMAWDIPMLTPDQAFADGTGVPARLPCWITRAPDVCERSWATTVFDGNTTWQWRHPYTATRTQFSTLFLENPIVFGETSQLLLGNRKPIGFGIRLLGHDYTAVALLDVIEVTLEEKTGAFSLAPVNLVWITDHYYANYYHCFIDYAARLSEVEFLVRDHGFFIGVPPIQAAILVPILEALGFGDHVYLFDRLPTVFPVVAVAASPQREQYCYPTAVRWLHDRVRARIRRGQPARILISRQDASSRRLVNEPALLLALKRFGVELFVPGATTPAEQLAVFASAELIIAPHGSALANLVACGPGTKVVEIASYIEPTMFFTNISDVLGLEHVLVQASAVGEDVLVSIDDVLNALRALGVSPNCPTKV